MKITELYFNSPYFNSPKKILLNLPENFKQNNEYDFYLLHDGQELFNFNNFQLIKHLNDKQVITIGICAEDEISRLNEYSSYTNDKIAPLFNLPNLILGGLGRKYINFIDNIIDKIQSEYHFKIKNFNIIGCSMGGFITLEMLNFSSRKINNLYIMSPAIWFNPQILSDLNNFNINKVYLWVGKKENRFFKYKIETNYESNLILLKAILLKNKVNLNVVIDNDGGHGWQWWVPYLATII